MLTPTVRYSSKPWSAPRSTAISIHSIAVTGTPAAAQASSTFTVAAMTSRSGMETAATTTVATASRPIQWRTPAPASSLPPATARETSRATAICRADPGTIRMMKADISTASEP
jgi:hypothetical protein